MACMDRNRGELHAIGHIADRPDIFDIGARIIVNPRMAPDLFYLYTGLSRPRPSVCSGCGQGPAWPVVRLQRLAIGQFDRKLSVRLLSTSSKIAPQRMRIPFASIVSVQQAANIVINAVTGFPSPR